MFLVVMLVLWTLLTAVIVGHGPGFLSELPNAAIYGVCAGYWIVVGLAMIDRLARAVVKGEMARYLFALLAGPFLMAMWPWIGSGPESSLPIDQQRPLAGALAIAPFLAVAVCMMARPDKAQANAEADAAEAT